MNYIKRMARGCCCSGNESGTSLQSALIDLVSRKLGELTGDPDNPLNLEEAARIVSEKLDELLDYKEIPVDSEFANDQDIADLFNP